MKTYLGLLGTCFQQSLENRDGFLSWTSILNNYIHSNNCILKNTVLNFVMKNYGKKLLNYLVFTS